MQVMLLFSIDFSGYGATIVSKLSLRFIRSVYTAPLQLLRRPLYFNF